VLGTRWKRNLCREKSKIKEWAARLDKLRETIVYYIENGNNEKRKMIETIILFYDECE
jgi:hypothetical protein